MTDTMQPQFSVDFDRVKAKLTAKLASTQSDLVLVETLAEQFQDEVQRLQAIVQAQAAQIEELKARCCLTDQEACDENHSLEAEATPIPVEPIQEVTEANEAAEEVA